MKLKKQELEKLEKIYSSAVIALSGDSVVLPISEFEGNQFAKIHSLYFEENVHAFIDNVLIPFYHADSCSFIDSFDDSLDQIEHSQCADYFNEDWQHKSILPLHVQNNTVVFAVSFNHFISNIPAGYWSFRTIAGDFAIQSVWHIVSDDIFSTKISELTDVNLIHRKSELDLGISQKGSQSKAYQVAEGIIDQMLQSAIEEGAADLEFKPVRIRESGKLWVDVNMTIDGDYTPYQKGLFYDHSNHFAVVDQVLARCNKPESENVVDGSFSKFGMDWRVCMMPSGNISEKAIVFRKLDPSSVLVPLDQVFLHPKLFSIMQSIPDRFSSGMIVITGATGSGKTTSIYSYLNDTYHAKLKNSRNGKSSIKIQTIEDPIEYDMSEWMSQHEVVNGVRSALDVLRGCLRMGPHWILVGEIRDKTMMIPTMHATYSGHLTVTTLHTSSNFETLSRMEELGVSREDIARNVLVFINQKLVKRLCNHCKKPVDSLPGQFRMGDGCHHCRMRGTKGRAMVCEFLFNDPENPDIFETLRDGGKEDLEAITQKQGITYKDYFSFLKSIGIVDHSSILLT